MPEEIDWSKIIDDAAKASDKKFKNTMSSLTSLTETDVVQLIESSGIKKENFAKVVNILQDATLANTAKANAIAKIGKGVNLIIGIAAKLI